MPWLDITTAVIAATPPTIAGGLAFLYAWRARKDAGRAAADIQKLHIEVNARLTELIKTSGALAQGIGHAAGVEQERIREETRNELLGE